MARYIARVWKSDGPTLGTPEWNNVYYFDCGASIDSDDLRAACTRIARAESGMMLPVSFVRRVDVGVVSGGGEMADPSQFMSVPVNVQGERPIPAGSAPCQWELCVQVWKQTALNRNGRQLYRYMAADNELNYSNPKQVTWNGTGPWLLVAHDRFHVNMNHPDVQHLTARYTNGSQTPVGYEPVQRWCFGPVALLLTHTDAQSRKRPEGIQARGLLHSALRGASEALRMLNELLDGDPPAVPNSALLEPERLAGLGVLAGIELDKYFTDFDAPLANLTRWERPRADPRRAVARQISAQWKQLEQPFQQLQQQKQPDPVTDMVDSGYVQGVRDMARNALFFANLVSVSRFT